MVVDAQMIADSNGFLFETTHMALPTTSPTNAAPATHVGYNNNVFDVIRTKASSLIF